MDHLASWLFFLSASSFHTIFFFLSLVVGRVHEKNEGWQFCRRVNKLRGQRDRRFRAITRDGPRCVDLRQLKVLMF
jgi:hypothetical protein